MGSKPENTLDSIPEDNIKTITNIKKSPKDESYGEYSVQRNIMDDNETLDNFFEDVSTIVSKKGINIDTGANKYTLFDDI